MVLSYCDYCNSNFITIPPVYLLNLHSGIIWLPAIHLERFWSIRFYSWKVFCMQQLNLLHELFKLTCANILVLYDRHMFREYVVRLHKSRLTGYANSDYVLSLLLKSIHHLKNWSISTYLCITYAHVECCILKYQTTKITFIKNISCWIGPLNGGIKNNTPFISSRNAPLKCSYLPPFSDYEKCFLAENCVYPVFLVLRDTRPSLPDC